VDAFTLDKIEFDAVRGILSGFCRCSLGKAMAAQVGPSRNPEIINRWLDQTSQMCRVVRDISLPPLGGVTDITEAVNRAKPGAGATPDDFAAIASTLEAAGEVKRFLDALPEDLDKLHELAPGIGTFEAEVAAIQAVIDPDGTVRDDASHRLATLRGEIAATAKQIHDMIYGYLHDPEVARLLQNVTVTLHGDRYVLPVKVENRGRLPGVVHRSSNTGATVFVEPNQCVELNNRLSDLYEDERREVQRLLTELAARIQTRCEDILSALRCLGQVDLVSAKAQYAHQFEMTRPTVSENGALGFTQARHPLLIDQAWRQEREGVPPQRRHQVVPIDVRLGADFDLLVITGSNTGGKTVTLKTVALLAVMVQSGLHVPVQRGSTMPVFRDFFIDVGDEQSLQQSLSTFGAHIKRVKYILSKADKSCLVLLDELGAGTDPEEGGAIGQAILDELRRIGCQGMVTTHLSILKAYAYNHERVDNASVEFDTVTMSPTYHLRIGTPGESHALAVARRLGMPKSVVAAAREHLSSQGKQFRRAIQATNVVRQSAEEARAQAQAAQLAAQTQGEAYESKLADLHRLKTEFETWLASLPELKPGDEVFVPSLNKPGKLVRLELHRQIALVDAENVQVEVPLRDLMPDLGQSAVREQIAALRQQILDQARTSEQAQAEATRIREEYHRSLVQQKERARQFDAWLGAVARVRVGDVVPINHRPGTGKVLKVDLPGLRATVQTEEGQLELSIQDLFPQTGPFSRMQPPYRPPFRRERQEAKPAEGGRPAEPPRRQDQRPPRRDDQRPPPPQRGQPPPQRESRRAGTAQGSAQPADQQVHDEPLDNRPMPRRQVNENEAAAIREAVLAIQPGQQVFVVPFQKRATVIRIDPDRNQAVVQSGIFEMELPLKDLEPIPQRRNEPPPPPKRPKRDAVAPRTPQPSATQKTSMETGDRKAEKPEEAPPAAQAAPPDAAPPEPVPPDPAPPDPAPARERTEERREDPPTAAETPST
jgi:DNA mismatch repair protein MutS2